MHVCIKEDNEPSIEEGGPSENFTYIVWMSKERKFG
jgi:hypothetical protein